MPGTINLFVFGHLILTTNLRFEPYYPYFTGEEAESKRGEEVW